MVGSTEVMDALKGIGLNLYERKILLALLAKGIATAAEVSEISSVPRSRSYDVLQSLADKGFVMLQPSKPIKYVALQPKEALDKTKEIMQQKHEELISRIEKIKTSSIADELDQIYKEGLSIIQPTEMTGTFKGKNIIDRELKSLFKQAQKNIDIVTTEKGLKDLHASHLRALKKAVNRGVNVRVVAPHNNDSIAKDVGNVVDLRNGDTHGRIWSIDGKQVVMALTGDDTHESQDVAFYVNSEHAAQHVVNPLFEQQWKK